MTKNYAYMRVSTNKQDTDRQENEIKSYAAKNNITIDKWFVDVISGKITNKPSWTEMKSVLQKNDTVMVLDFDRIGRDWDNIIEEYNWLVQNYINLKIVNFDMLDIHAERLDTTLEEKLIKNMAIQIACYSAQAEREKLSRRTKEGLAATKAKGTVLGRRSTLDMKVVEEAIDFYLNSDYPVNAIANKYGLNIGTLESHISRRKLKAKDRSAEPKHKYNLSEKMKYGHRD